MERRLLEACDVYQPRTITKKEMSLDGAYPVYGANGVIGRYHEYNHEESEVLLGCRGSCGSVNVSAPKSWITGNAMVVRPKAEDLDSRLLRYFLLATRDIDGVITGVAQPQITRKSLEPVTIRHPAALPEQERIVAILDEAFEAIAAATANTEKNFANARELFEDYLYATIDANAHRDQWNEAPIEDSLLSIIDFRGRTPKKLGLAWASEGIPALSALNVRDGAIDMGRTKHFGNEALYEKWMTRGHAARGDVVLTTEAPLGNVAQIPDDQKYILSQRVVLLKPRRDVLAAEFLAWGLRSAGFQRKLRTNETGATAKGIRMATFKGLPFAVPPLPQQMRIVSRLSECNSRVGALAGLYAAKAKKLSDLKESILNKAFSGELTAVEREMSDAGV